MSDLHSGSDPRATHRSGLLFGLACYGIWGVLPLYFVQLDFAPDLEIVAHRALWTLLICVGVLAFTGKLRDMREALTHPRQLGFLALAAALIAANWLIYVYAANHQQVLQASLGYFTNPLLTVGLGVLVLRERLRPLQWLAMGIGLTAVLVIAVGDGQLPWIALGLAFSFALYGLTKSFAGRRSGAFASLGVETLLLSPLAAGALWWMTAHGQSHFTTHGATSMLLLASTGIITAAPLTLFAAAARRLPLSVVGMLQYIAPTLQFIIAVAVNHEPMPPSHWIGFGIIWFALAILTTDALRHNRRNARLRRKAALMPASETSQ
ncbi:EamA family transporter RarD [Oleiagrimonas sp. MCCC 1A03011]|uniref:EamA family transporter RarD n=1 Tax=Oleiagrimonas sp. MCCC 1A03011 TaxID=1926883 RepID=UPI001980E281|nr:EamA family transporter RarD [Oleiagrimonas sp. MCCC 1A03011]